jgi:tRNA(Arg) A34 adenosine deaminase TadA
MESPKPQLANMYYAPAENTRKNDVLMRYTSEVLSNEMLKQVREDASAAYHCSASCGINLIGSTPLVTLNTSAPISEPSKLDMAAELMKKIVNDAAEKVDPDKVTKVKENMLKEAEISLSEGGIPIGAVLVKDNEVISRGHNRLIQNDSVILHGEMDAIENAKGLNYEDYRKCTLYTTLAPCPMCSGAVLLYNIPKMSSHKNKILMNFQTI